MRGRIPPHIGWPVFIVGLLLVSIGASVATFVLATSDGGAQVVEDYYQKGVRWDETAALRAASAALGWQVQVAVQAGGAQAGLRTVDVVVRDRAGHLVTGLQGTVRLTRPQHARAVAELPLQPVAGVPGLYRLEAPIDAAGLWDFELQAVRDS